MTQLSPTALKAARVAWLESASDYTRLDTSISAAITAYLAQREKEGFVEVPRCDCGHLFEICEGKMTSLRSDSALWREFTAAARSVVGEWTDDQIAAVMKKVRGKSPDDLLESISQVFVYCGAAMKSGNEEAIATVELW